MPYGRPRIQIKTKVVEHYKECSKYHGQLAEYNVGTFITCFNKVTRVMIEKEDVALTILVKLKKSLVLLAFAQ